MYSDSSGSMYKGNPDKGPEMKEGAHKFDKGYVSDEEMFSPTRHDYPDNKERGNDYLPMNNKWQKEDAKKLGRSRFSKVA